MFYGKIALETILPCKGISSRRTDQGTLSFDQARV